MNLKELDELLNHLQRQEPKNLDLIAFYSKKRLELIGLINININTNINNKLQEINNKKED